MRILLINQFFWPDSSATSQLLTDVARDLAERGHEVFAVCGASGYAVQSGGRAPAVTIFRVKSSQFKRGKVGRIASYASFHAGALVRVLSMPKPDLVMTLTTPPLISLVGTIAKKLRGSEHFIWEMDMYPDVAVDLKYMSRTGWIAKATGALADWSRTHADGIIALGECMKQRLQARGVDSKRVFVAENWADGQAVVPLPRPNSEDGRLVLLYSGNLGLAHDLDTLTAAMLKLRSDERFEFAFAGSGSRTRELASFVAEQNLGNVSLRPYVERESLGKSLAAGDIGLVTQRPECCGSVVPSKVYGLLAAGRPVLFVGPRNATPAQIISRFECGWHIECGDAAGLTELLLRLADRRQEIVLAGINARRALDQHFDIRFGVERIANILGAITSKPNAKQFRNAIAQTVAANAAKTES